MDRLDKETMMVDIETGMEMYTCKLPSGGAIRLSKKRFYQSEEEANRHKIKRPIRRSPYDFE